MTIEAGRSEAMRTEDEVRAIVGCLLTDTVSCVIGVEGEWPNDARGAQIREWGELAIAALMRLMEPYGLSAPLSHSTGITIGMQYDAVLNAATFFSAGTPVYAKRLLAALETLRWVQGLRGGAKV